MCGLEAGGATMLRRVKFGLMYTYVYIRTKYIQIEAVFLIRLSFPISLGTSFLGVSK